MHYLITGHTGFKGSWLALWLVSRGHQVSGVALDPIEGALFETAKLSELLTHDLRVDIRDAATTIQAVTKVAPDVVFHLAAQPLVRRSYEQPRFTVETNVMGTFNVLEAVSQSPTVRATVIVTTDKVYRNINQVEGYVENDPLGGVDPYSVSKAMADLLTQAWAQSFPGSPMAIARAGNVIGGGDVSPDRLLPDLLKSFSRGESQAIRYPEAVRPWQHVLDCLNGYLSLSDALLNGAGLGEWNFGPGKANFLPVSRVADVAATKWGAGASWHTDARDHPHEANILALDASKAEEQLGWDNHLDFSDSIGWTVDWYREVGGGESARESTLAQIREFETLTCTGR